MPQQTNGDVEFTDFVEASEKKAELDFLHTDDEHVQAMVNRIKELSKVINDFPKLPRQ